LTLRPLVALSDTVYVITPKCLLPVDFTSFEAKEGALVDTSRVSMGSSDIVTSNIIPVDTFLDGPDPVLVGSNLTYVDAVSKSDLGIDVSSLLKSIPIDHSTFLAMVQEEGALDLYYCSYVINSTTIEKIEIEKLDCQLNYTIQVQNLENVEYSLYEGRILFGLKTAENNTFYSYTTSELTHIEGEVRGTHWILTQNQVVSFELTVSDIRVYSINDNNTVTKTQSLRKAQFMDIFTAPDWCVGASHNNIVISADGSIV
jgi:hypothetical protein